MRIQGPPKLSKYVESNGQPPIRETLSQNQTK